ncbi:hypothetical protein EFJ78_08810 [Pediococcus pentosaceus]|uniref:hypothetical protein n=1 Tax=Pediococcus pentosaceus TaxID=1255 RepID=UPI00223AE93E|nr:hypothetical protein [Pediococcus pentosaceus]MCS8563919.1 hypothetical protein [Pediococcus pentosaceus]MCS8568214.1 hypothetical protein [Pediococcus pentosaceus]MCS8580856.1 hypothetical protein [Pediococcus pentosaceus]
MNKCVFEYKPTIALSNLFEQGRIIKRKTQIIPLVMEIIETLSNAKDLKIVTNSKEPKFGLIHKKRINRFIYIVGQDRFITFHNPFKVEFSSNGNLIFTEPKSEIQLNAVNITIVKNFFKISKAVIVDEKNGLNKGIMNFEDDIYNAADAAGLSDELSSSLDSNKNLKDWWYLIYRLLCFEPGYIRYDFDEKNCSEHHPLNHLDVNIENSIKLGLDNRITNEEFINILLTNGEVKYLR